MRISRGSRSKSFLEGFILFINICTLSAGMNAKFSLKLNFGTIIWKLKIHIIDSFNKNYAKALCVIETSESFLSAPLHNLELCSDHCLDEIGIAFVYCVLLLFNNSSFTCMSGETIPRFAIVFWCSRVGIYSACGSSNEFTLTRSGSFRPLRMGWSWLLPIFLQST